VELLDGSRKKILLDSGWAYDWTEECFKREGLTRCSKKEIDCLIISHEHFDHFWGLPVSLKYNPEILSIFGGFYQEGFSTLRTPAIEAS
jgi:7,8-dihydropterin-6-yl-methyl-4-(beta-D-ribofuranosyl)aminobenzene 5'-phosphate synthase